MIGVSCAYAFFILGLHTHGVLASFFEHSNAEIVDEHDDVQLTTNLTHGAEPVSNHCEEDTDKYGEWRGDSRWWKWITLIFNVYFGPLFFVAAFVTYFLVGALIYDIEQYEARVLGLAMAPVGALVRWKLSAWNDPTRGPFCGVPNRWSWIPRGTLFANLLASTISALIAAVELRYLSDYHDPWLSELLPAVKVGFAGSLSTVSTMIKEMATMDNPKQSLAYVSGSLILAMLLGLLVFSPIARSGD